MFHVKRRRTTACFRTICIGTNRFAANRVLLFPTKQASWGPHISWEDRTAAIPPFPQTAGRLGPPICGVLCCVLLFPTKQASRGPLFVILNREAVKNLPRIKKTKPNGRSVIAPTNIHERDSELVGAVIDRPQTVRKVEGRRFFVTLFLRMTNTVSKCHSERSEESPACRSPEHGALQAPMNPPVTCGDSPL